MVGTVVMVIDGSTHLLFGLNRAGYGSSEDGPLLQNLVHRFDERIGTGNFDACDELGHRYRFQELSDGEVVVFRAAVDDEIDGPNRNAGE